jgi:hypothetical protein
LGPRPAYIFRADVDFAKIKAKRGGVVAVVAAVAIVAAVAAVATVTSTTVAKVTAAEQQHAVRSGSGGSI